MAPFVVLGAWSLLVTVLLARHGLHNHYVFRDEANEIVFGRQIAHDLSLAIGGDVARGPERLTGFFAAAAALVLDSPTRQLELLHLWAAICQGLVALPLWLAARQLGLDRWQALVPATIGSSGSFAFYGVLTLPTSVALLSAMLLLCAMLHALRRPGLRADVLLIAALALMVLARIGWAPLVAALAPATLATCWLERPTGESFRAWLRCLPRRLLRRHPLLVPLAALLLVVALVAGPSSLLGGTYGGVRLKAHIVGSILWDNTLVLGAHLAIGTALVPFVLALPVLARGLVRPHDPVEGGFAWLLLGFVVIFSWAYYASMNEDRYFAVLAPPLILAGTLAVFRRRPPLWSIVVSGTLVVWLVASSYAWPVSDVFVHFVAPTSQFFVDLPIGKLSVVLSGVDHDILAAVATTVAVLAAMIAVAISRRWHTLGPAGPLVAGALIAGLLAYQLVALDHPAQHFVDGVGLEALTAEQLEFVDRATGDAQARPLAFGSVMDPDLDAQVPFLRAFNDAIEEPLTIAIAGDTTLDPDVTIDWRSGRTDAHETPPALLLQVAGAAPVGFAGTPLPPSPLFPWLQLLRLRTPLRTSWIVQGAALDRYPPAGTPLTVRVYADGTANRCLSGAILAHPFQTQPVAFALSAGNRARHGSVRPTEPLPFVLPLDGTRPVTVTLTGRGGLATDGVRRGPTLSNLRVAPCALR